MRDNHSTKGERRPRRDVGAAFVCVWCGYKPPKSNRAIKPTRFARGLSLCYAARVFPYARHARALAYLCRALRSWCRALASCFCHRMPLDAARFLHSAAFSMSPSAACSFRCPMRKHSHRSITGGITTRCSEPRASLSGCSVTSGALVGFISGVTELGRSLAYQRKPIVVPCFSSCWVMAFRSSAFAFLRVCSADSARARHSRVSAR